MWKSFRVFFGFCFYRIVMFFFHFSLDEISVAQKTFLLYIYLNSIPHHILYTRTYMYTYEVSSTYGILPVLFGFRCAYVWMNHIEVVKTSYKLSLFKQKKKSKFLDRLNFFISGYLPNKKKKTSAEIHFTSH